MIEKILDWLDRAKSRVYGILIAWLIIGFSPVIFASLFVDQQLIYVKTGMLKNEYIRSIFFNLSTFEGWVYPIAVLALALIMTRLVIWDFPEWFVNRAYRQEVRSQMQREFAKIEVERELNEKKNQLVDEQLETVEKEKTVIQVQKDIDRPVEEKWLEDYREFKTSKRLYSQFYLIPESIFEHFGRTKDRVGYSDEFEVPVKLLSYAHSNGLIDIDLDNHYISLTDKGKFFLKQYELENQ